MAGQFEWQQYLEMILCFACFVLIAFDLQLITRFQLYKSYGTGCIFLLLTLSMILRVVYLIYSICVLGDKHSEIFMEVIVLAPNFLMTMVSLSFYTQWLETYHFLKQNEIYHRLKQRGTYNKCLYISHGLCILLYILDIVPRIVYSLNSSFFQKSSWQVMFLCGESLEAAF